MNRLKPVGRFEISSGYKSASCSNTVTYAAMYYWFRAMLNEGSTSETFYFACYDFPLLDLLNSTSHQTTEMLTPGNLQSYVSANSHTEVPSGETTRPIWTPELISGSQALYDEFYIVSPDVSNYNARASFTIVDPQNPPTIRTIALVNWPEKDQFPTGNLMIHSIGELPVPFTPNVGDNSVFIIYSFGLEEDAV